MSMFATKCLICEECVKLYNPNDNQPKICDKCKEVILKLRKQGEK